jgi:hypothetical protein
MDGDEIPWWGWVGAAVFFVGISISSPLIAYLLGFA